MKPPSIGRQASVAYSVIGAEGARRIATSSSFSRSSAMCHKPAQTIQNERRYRRYPRGGVTVPTPVRRQGGGAAPESAPASGGPPQNQCPGGAGAAHPAKCFKPNKCAAEAERPCRPHSCIQAVYGVGGDGGRQPVYETGAHLSGPLARASDVSTWLYGSRVCGSHFGPYAIWAKTCGASMRRWSCLCLRTCLGRVSVSGVRSMSGPSAACAVCDLVLWSDLNG